MSLYIEVKLRDGSKRQFDHKGRAGGSYTVSLTFDSGFAVITDEYGKRTVIPESLISEIIEKPL